MNLFSILLLTLFSFQAQAGVVQFASGDSHSCALFDSGQLKCWGNNDKGQLGLGDTLTRGNKSGQMGLLLPAVDLGTGATHEKITQLVAGGSHTCVLFDSGRVKCFGDNTNGELGTGEATPRGITPLQMGANLPYVDLGDTNLVAKLFSGKNHVCALLQSGSLKCWGNNAAGQLGLEDTKNRGNLAGQMGNALPVIDLGMEANIKVIQVTGGQQHSCALLDSGKVKCWGRNTEGEEGSQDSIQRGNTAGTMGSKLPFLNFGDEKVVQLRSGDYHSCALMDDGKVKCWGYGSRGQIGNLSSQSYGASSAHMGATMPAVDFGTTLKVIDLRAGAFFNCVQFEDKSLKCWGQNSNGQLGIGTTEDMGDEANEMGTFLPFVKIVPGQKITAVFPKYDGTCVLVDQVNELECWGRNNTGQLGFDDTQDRGTTIDSLGDNLSFVDLGD